MSSRRRPFLLARWEKLLLFSYPAPAELLRPYLPAGTALDLFEREAFVSLVAFCFQPVRLGALPICWFPSFPELNLRFYVRRCTPQGTLRGIVFIRELAPSRLAVFLGNLLYHEHYRWAAMSYATQAPSPIAPVRWRYSWRLRGDIGFMEADVASEARYPKEGTLEEFLTHRFWAFTRSREGRSYSFWVEHAPWTVSSVGQPALHANIEQLYGKGFARILQQKPCHALASEGSLVAVSSSTRMPTEPLERATEGSARCSGPFPTKGFF
jgi:uncharacterized protein YqjF (DUF2071 family)